MQPHSIELYIFTHYANFTKAQTQTHTCTHECALVEEATESKGGHFAKLK